MIELFGKKYMTEKEAANKYGYSVSWFKMKRFNKLEPNYSKLEGKIYYDCELLEKYFKDHMIEY
jgi:hypothetical protein